MGRFGQGVGKNLLVPAPGLLRWITGKAGRRSHDLAQDLACGFETSQSGPVVLGNDYVKRALPVAERRLAPAGIRLAHALNQIFFVNGL